MSTGHVRFLRQKEVRFDIAPEDGPHFLTSMAIIDEDDGNICIAVYKENGIYALARVSRSTFRKSVDLLCGEDDGVSDSTL